MTLLEAVNLCLRSTGEKDVAAINSAHPKLQTILAEIHTVSMRVQRRGWWFNTAVRDLVPATAGPNAGKVEAGDYDFVKPTYRYLDYFPQNSLMVDRSTGEAVTAGFQAYVRWSYPTTEEGWGSIPDSVSDYIAYDAALSYAANYDADQLQLQKLTTQRVFAKAEANAEHVRYAQVNMFNLMSTGAAINNAFGRRYYPGMR